MNKSRRLEIRSILTELGIISSRIEAVLDSENDALNNLPENLQGGALYESISDAVDMISDALDCINETQEVLERVV